MGAFPSKNQAKKIWIKKAMAAQPTGKELPTVTTNENGKVLKVDAGQWAVGTDAT